MEAVWWAWALACLALAAAAASAVVAVRARARSVAAEDRARTEVACLRTRVAVLERALAARASVDLSQDQPATTDLPPQEEIIEPSRVLPPDPVEARLFADLLLREAVVRAASWTHGVRRALRPEVRNRMRFEMRHEIKRARRQRRLDLREARRRLRGDLRARERAA